MRNVRFIVALLIVCCTVPAFGWGPDGHRIVCQIAMDNLTNAQQDEVNRLINAYRKHGANFTTFPQSCVFPDNVRDIEVFNRFTSTHFLNVPRNVREISADFCPGTCVLKGIEEHTAALKNAANDEDRAEALMFLGHWLGDIHQPLHISYADDRGGNDINRILGGFYQSNNNQLHRVWDSGIILKMMGPSWGDYADKLAKEIDGVERSEWEDSDHVKWAQESYDITTSKNVLYCRMDGDVCESMGNTRTLTSAYQSLQDDVINTRLQKGGIRLAELIRENLPLPK